MITLADAENFRPDIFGSVAAHNQFRYADAVLVNKCDLVDDYALCKIEARIRELKGDARILRTTRSQVPLPLVLGVGSREGDKALVDEPGDHDHVASDGFSAVSFASQLPLAVDKFQTFLNRDLPEGVFRGKGILWVAESDARYVFHLVGKRFSLDESRWDGPRRNTLVLIGRGLDGEELRRRLEACLAAVPGS